jgi:hypothetical protein
LAESLGDLQRRAAALAEAIGRELTDLERAWAASAPRGALEGRVLPLRLTAPGAGPEALRWLALERRSVRLRREGAVLREQSEALRARLHALPRVFRSSGRRWAPSVPHAQLGPARPGPSGTAARPPAAARREGAPAPHPRRTVPISPHGRGIAG